MAESLKKDEEPVAGPSTRIPDLDNHLRTIILGLEGALDGNAEGLVKAPWSLPDKTQKELVAKARAHLEQEVDRFSTSTSNSNVRECWTPESSHRPPPVSTGLPEAKGTGTMSAMQRLLASKAPNSTLSMLTWPQKTVPPWWLANYGGDKGNDPSSASIMASSRDEEVGSVGSNSTYEGEKKRTKCCCCFTRKTFLIFSLGVVVGAMLMLIIAATTDINLADPGKNGSSSSPVASELIADPPDSNRIGGDAGVKGDSAGVGSSKTDSTGNNKEKQNDQGSSENNKNSDENGPRNTANSTGGLGNNETRNTAAGNATVDLNSNSEKITTPKPNTGSPMGTKSDGLNSAQGTDKESDSNNLEKGKNDTGDKEATNPESEGSPGSNGNNDTLNSAGTTPTQSEALATIDSAITTSAPPTPRSPTITENSVSANGYSHGSGESNDASKKWDATIPSGDVTQPSATTQTSNAGDNEGSQSDPEQSSVSKTTPASPSPPPTTVPEGSTSIGHNQASQGDPEQSPALKTTPATYPSPPATVPQGSTSIGDNQASQGDPEQSSVSNTTPATTAPPPTTVPEGSTSIGDNQASQGDPEQSSVSKATPASPSPPPTVVPEGSTSIGDSQASQVDPEQSLVLTTTTTTTAPPPTTGPEGSTSIGSNSNSIGNSIVSNTYGDGERTTPIPSSYNPTDNSGNQPTVKTANEGMISSTPASRLDTYTEQQSGTSEPTTIVVESSPVTSRRPTSASLTGSESDSKDSSQTQTETNVAGESTRSNSIEAATVTTSAPNYGTASSGNGHDNENLKQDQGKDQSDNNNPDNLGNKGKEQGSSSNSQNSHEATQTSNPDKQHGTSNKCHDECGQNQNENQDENGNSQHSNESTQTSNANTEYGTKNDSNNDTNGDHSSSSRDSGNKAMTTPSSESSIDPSLNDKRSSEVIPISTTAPKPAQDTETVEDRSTKAPKNRDKNKRGDGKRKGRKKNRDDEDSESSSSSSEENSSGHDKSKQGRKDSKNIEPHEQRSVSTQAIPIEESSALPAIEVVQSTPTYPGYGNDISWPRRRRLSWYERILEILKKVVHNVKKSLD